MSFLLHTRSHVRNARTPIWGGTRERGSPLRDIQAARFYELMVISTPEGTPEELLEASEKVGNHVSAFDGTLIRANHDSPWGRRRLAYPIRHASQDLRDGFYTLYHFQLQPNRIPEIERELQLDERVIRHLLLTLPGEPVFPEPEEAEEGAGEGEAASDESLAASAEEEGANLETDVDTASNEVVASDSVEDPEAQVDSIADDVETDVSSDVEALAEDASKEVEE